MPQITLSVPNEKLPLVHEFLQALGIEGYDMSQIFRKSRKAPSSITQSSLTYQQSQSWEYYCNELEFE